MKLNFWLDLTIFAGFLIAFEPRMTGVNLHEWFTVATVGTLIIHFLLHWDWFMKLTARFFENLFHSSRLNYILAVLIFIGFTAIITSGLLISEHVIPFLGLEREHAQGWKGIHELASNLTLLLVAVHVALRWEWVKSACVRLLITPFVKRRGGNSQPASVDD